MTSEEFVRLANNFYISRGAFSDVDRINLDIELFNHINSKQDTLKTKHKVALVCICLNPLYWEYANEMVTGAKNFFLPGHQTDFFFWSDIPKEREEVVTKIKEAFKSVPEKNINTESPNVIAEIEKRADDIISLWSKSYVNIIPTEPTPWPYPTLLRYNLFLQQEEKMKDYDYIFYCDIDMKFVSIVGDEVLGEITAAQHPMYALAKKFWPPYEPDENSASYIKRPGRVVLEGNKPRFMPLYFAGGFQGGKSDKFIEAMKQTKLIIEKDLDRGYIPIWNDESAWNKYLSENPPDVVLTPSYVYPDSLIKEYYEPTWGCSYQPKLVTVTKWFTTNKEGGQAVQELTKK